MDQFYATLPSDANPEQFPENNSSNWITSLNPPLQLEGEWLRGDERNSFTEEQR